MRESPAFLAERLRAEEERMTVYFTSLTRDQWVKVIYTDGDKWKVRDILAHFVAVEKFIIRLFESILEGGEGASEEFSIDRFNAEQVMKLAKLSPCELVALYKQGRACMIEWVSSLSESDLQKTGRHPYLGITTLGEMIKMVYRHNQIHLRDLRRI